MSAFDPYHKWLAIPPDEQPPHHYRLLGTGLFETDPDVIDTAAEQRMAYLRTCAGGEHVAASQRLLNEVSAARLCLLNPQKKAAYDAQLQAQLAPPEPESEPDPFAEMDEFEGLDGSAGFDGRTSADADVPAVARPKRRPLGQRAPVAEPPPFGLMVVGGVAVLGVVVLVGGLFAFRMFGERTDVAEGATTDDGETVIAIDARNRRDPEPPPKTVSPPPRPVPIPTPPPRTDPPFQSTTPVGGGPAPAVVPFDAAEAKAYQAAWAGHLGVPVETTNTVGMRLVLIPPGRFDSADSPRGRPVAVQSPLRIGAHEVTRAQWKAVMGTEPWAKSIDVRPGDDRPASLVTWSDILEFCKKLTASERAAGRIAADETYWLPTSGEWEFAARAGTAAPYPCGADEACVADHAWYTGSTVEGDRFARPVGLKAPNAWGLHDVLGNVREWCCDGSGGVTAPGDPLPEPSTTRYSRGGSCGDPIVNCSLTTRLSGSHGVSSATNGFRVVLHLTSAPRPAGTVPPPSNPLPTIPAPTVAAVPQWIWHGTTARDCVLRKEFPGGVTFAFLVATADDEMTVFVDGRQVAASRIWSSPFPVDLLPHLAKDRAVHVLQVVGRNAASEAGFVARLVLAMPDGRRIEIVSDGTWESAETADAATWSKASVIAPLSGGRWNEGPYNRPLGAQVTRILTSSTIVPPPSGPSGPSAVPWRGPLLGSGTAKIDCLPLVDPSRVRRIGRWSRSPDGRGLTGTNGETQGSIAIEVPVTVDGNYSVAVRFRRGGRDKVFLQLPVGASVVHAYLDGMLSRLGGRSGLDRIDGREYSDNPSTVNGPRLPDGSASVIATVAVRGDAATIVVGVEGRGEVIRWSGPVSSLSVDPASIVPRGSVLAVAAGPDCKGIEFESFVLELQGGTAYATAPGSSPSVGPSPSDPSPVVPGGTNLPVPVVERGKVPEGAALKQAEARVQDVFGTDFAGAKKPDEKRALGRKLLTQAETATDAERDVRYVLCRRARDLAIETGDVSTATEAVRRLERHFDFDAAALRTDTLVALARTADATRDVEALARASLDAAESLLATADLEPADRLLLLVTGALRKFRSPSLTARQAALRTRHTEKKAAFAAADAARRTLETKPDDPAANLAWGLFLCGAKQDWDAGLTRLAKGGDADLAKIVELERAAANGTPASTDPAEPLRLADAWWDWIEKSPADRRPLRTAAHYWYLRARPAASGLDRVKIDRRLLEIGTPSPPRRWPVP